jgi:hypothetical protein
MALQVTALLDSASVPLEQQGRLLSKQAPFLPMSPIDFIQK